MNVTVPRRSRQYTDRPSVSTGLPTNEEFYRVSTFRNALEGLTGNVLARRGFFYNEQSREVECFSCGVRHRLHSDQYHRASDITHLDACAFNNGNDRRNVPMILSSSGDVGAPHFPTSSRRNVSPTFRHQRFHAETSIYTCDNPVYDRMQNLEDRMATFRGNWRPTNTQCSVREIAEAGFFYIGPDDEVLCWYCGGGLERWRYRDDPWLEHAKFHSECEYLLSRKGIEYVASVVDETPYVTRPTIRRRRRSLPSPTQHSNGVFWQGFPFNGSSENTNNFSGPNWERTDVNISGVGRQTTYRSPGITVTTTQRASHRRSAPPVIVTPEQPLQDQLGRAMASSLVFEVMDMGFSRYEIRNTLFRRLRDNEEIYDNAADLIDDILTAREDPQSIVSQPSVWNNQNLTLSITSPPSQRTVVEPTGERDTDETRPAVTFSTSNQLEQNSSLSEERPSQAQENASESALCLVCTERPVKVVFLPCAHLVTCQECGMTLTQCLVCDVAIERNVEVRNR